MKRIIAICALLLLLSVAACSTTETTTEPETVSSEVVEETVEETAEEAVEETTDETATTSEQVEITLIDPLDGVTNSYCLDIAGGNQDIDPANGLQAHTCYSYQGDLGTDQVFDVASFADGILYMPVYDVCAQVASVAAGAEIGLATCDGSELQSFVFGEDGTISPASDTSLCATASSETRFGRSDTHQISDLALAACSDDLAIYQQWGYRASLEDEITVIGGEHAMSDDAMTEEAMDEEMAEEAVDEEMAEEAMEEEVAEEAVDEEMAEEAMEEVVSEQVEITLIDPLDGVTNSYCLDIAGGNQDIDPANGLQAHTCYSYQGDLGTDQVFDTAEFANGLLYMPVYDVCAQVASVAAGAEVGLAACDGNELQSFVFGEGGTISPASDTSLCVTASSETRFGRSDTHQISDLALATCSDDMAIYQQWGYRTSLEDEITVIK